MLVRDYILEICSNKTNTETVNAAPDLGTLQSQANHVIRVPLHYDVTRPQVADGGDGLHIWRVAVNVLNN
jgi:hypothetical protein